MRPKNAFLHINALTNPVINVSTYWQKLIQKEIAKQEINVVLMAEERDKKKEMLAEAAKLAVINAVHNITVAQEERYTD